MDLGRASWGLLAASRDLPNRVGGMGKGTAGGLPAGGGTRGDLASLGRLAVGAY